MARNLRMLTGSALFLFVTCHLLNMAFGLVSVDAVDAARTYLTAPWTLSPVSVVLMLCLLTHMALGLYALYRRNTLRVPAYDAAQLVFGLLVIPLLASHIVGIYAAKNLFGYDPTYRIILSYFWLDAPLEGLRQVFVVIVVWVHGSIGIFSWMRLKPWWERVAWLIYPFFVAVPVLALLGFVDAGNDIMAEAAIVADQAAAQPAEPPADLSEAERAAAAERDARILASVALQKRILWIVLSIYAVLVIVTLAARAARLWARGRTRAVVHYRDGPSVESEVGPSLLEISRMHDVPHANLCRGRGRCGTCRVRIVDADGELNPPAAAELQTLGRLGAPADVRLACRTFPHAGEIVVERLVAPDIMPNEMALKQSVGTRPASRATPEAADA